MREGEGRRKTFDGQHLEEREGHPGPREAQVLASSCGGRAAPGTAVICPEVRYLGRGVGAGLALEPGWSEFNA